jgi:2-keto-4-pentenoate hydratase/2-oxohepta-3-ene-1,7-dioic acid hydratase in catechol pathway
MKLCRFEFEGTARIGVFGRQITDLSPIILDDMAALIRHSDCTIPAIKSYVNAGPPTIDRETIKLLTPVTTPPKILCSGINYYGHLNENPNAVLPESPFFFTKLPNTVIGPEDAIVKPAATDKLDYEVELAIVIGKRMHLTEASKVMDCVFGYTILNDVIRARCPI